jgi:N-acylneuraminate cytidylyltransferase/pseudaminic acid cytidylyltransferase
MNLCIIPARGGSKRIPKKNIKDFNGKPLIAYSIETAKKSKLFSKIVVSTDNEEIAKISENFGAEILIRPKELADDYAGSTEVFEHAIKELNKTNEFEYACMIYPTAPLLRVEYLKKGLDELKKSDACFLFAATSYDFPIWRGFEIVKSNAKMIFPEFMSTRSQDLKEIYHDAGAFYWKKLSCKKTFHFDNAIPIIMPRYLVVDIDTEEDFIMAEKLYKINKNEFDKWDELKQKLNKKSRYIDLKERKIFLVAVGKNIGVESYGKGDFFVRPVLVYKKLGRDYFLGIPLTSKEKKGNYFFEFEFVKGKKSYAMFNQIRTFSSNRVIKFLGRISRKDFYLLKEKFINFITT